MPSLTSSVQLQNRVDPQTVESQRPAPPSTAEVDFARILAATVRQQAEQALLGGGPQPFQQLGFLHEPLAYQIPHFMARRWRSEQVHAQETAPMAPPAPPQTAGENRQAKPPAVTGEALPGDAATPVTSSPVPRPVQATNAAEGVTSAATAGSVRPMPLDAFPRPPGDNGRGIHWIPTPHQSKEVIDKYIREAVAMGIKWVTFLNEGTRIGDNDYLVEQLVAHGIEPILRVYTDGGAPIQGDLAALVRHYRAKGVHYFQLYNEPNLRVENQGQPPDPVGYVDKWLPAARTVLEAGGIPGFGALSPTPGLAPGAAPGDMDDLAFLREAVREIRRRGAEDVLARSWLSVHNYGTEHLRVREYDRILREELGWSMPQIGTEAGIYPAENLPEEAAARIVADAYRYLSKREPYYFAYTYWIIANETGTGRPADPAWNHQALFRPDGGVNPLVQILKGGDA